MRLRQYLRGLGLGIIVTTLIISAGKRGSAAELTDDEIRAKARQLGMVEEDEMLLSAAQELADSVAKADDEKKKSLSPDTVSDDTVSKDALSQDLIAPGTVSDGNSSGKDDPGVPGGLKGAGAESALESGPKKTGNIEDKGSDDPGKTEAKPVQTPETEINPEEAVSDAGKGSATLKTSSSSDKKASSSSDKKTSSSSDKKATSSSDKKTSSSSEKKTETPVTAETPAVETPEAKPVQEPAAVTPAGSVTIVKGESSTAVAKKLQQAGFVQDAMQFDQYLCLNGYDRHLVTGNHAIPAGASARDIAEIITGK